MDGLHRNIKQTIRTICDAVVSNNGQRKLNIAGKKNTAIARNIGSYGSRRSATSSQSVRVVQKGDEMREETDVRMQTRSDTEGGL